MMNHVYEKSIRPPPLLSLPSYHFYARESVFAGIIVTAVLFGRRVPFSPSFSLTSLRPSESCVATSNFCCLACFFSRSIWRVK